MSTIVDNLRPKWLRLPPLIAAQYVTIMLILWYGLVAFHVSYAQHFLLFHSGPGTTPYDWYILKHEQVVTNIDVAPMQYRIMSYMIPELIHRALGVGVSKAYGIWRVASLWASLVALHFYLRTWFDTRSAFAGSLAFATMYTWFATQIMYIMATELPEFLFLTLSLLALARKKPGWVLLLAPLAMTFRETAVYILIAWAGILLVWPPKRIFQKEQRKEVLLLVLATLLTTATRAATLLYLGPKYWPTEQYGPRVKLFLNLVDPQQYLFAVLTLGVLWVLPWIRFRSAPRFLKGTSFLFLTVFAAVLYYGRPFETRLFMPMLLAVIPLSLWSLGWQNDSPTEQDTSLSSINPT
jgi:hypothetical protein